MSIKLADDKMLTITTTGGDRDGAFYVQSLKVNGLPWDRAWGSWDDIFTGHSSMEFVLGTRRVDWATGDLPPSPAS
jgi:putative alpha-1,2-mannosidase